MAHTIAKRSPDPQTQVGAIIVNSDNVILGAGYNAMPRGIDQDKFGWHRDLDWLRNKYGYVVHAEANAIYNASQSVKGATIYCTLFPCNECAKALIQNGIARVVYDQHRTRDYIMASERLLDSAGIPYENYS